MYILLGKQKKASSQVQNQYWCDKNMLIIQKLRLILAVKQLETDLK
jgi:hypothetical protein